MLSPIKTNLQQKLQDKGYRHRFFKGLAEDEIACGLRRFRIERGLNQSELAERCGMKQSAISRIEQSSYSKWNFNTLWRIADALDVRVAVKIDKMEDAISEVTNILTPAITGTIEQHCTITGTLQPGMALGFVLVNGGQATANVAVGVAKFGDSQGALTYGK
jgi:DNA-binding Xre family transcriptional regulator